MAIPNVIINKGQGGLGRALIGEDHITGLIFFIANADLPSGFGTSDRIKEVFSIDEAEALGITEGSATTGVLWYDVNEYFRQQPKGDLYIGLYDDTSPDLTSIELMQAFANGKIRQIGVHDAGTTFAASATTTLQASVANLNAVDMPLEVIYAADFSGVSNLSTLADLRALSNPNVSVVLGEDGAGAGAALAVSTSASVTALGAVLGAVSLAAVNENVGWIAKFNFATTTEFEVPAMANGDLVKDLSASLLSTLNDRGYIFLRKFVGIAGSYANDSNTCVTAANDFAYIENNRVMNKAIRNVRVGLLPNLNSPILVNEDGTLSEETIAIFKNDADAALDQMLRDNEVSAKAIIIDPAQNVLTTSEVVVTVQIVPVGVSRTITVNISFTTSIT